MNLVGYRAERKLWWTAADGAVQYVETGEPAALTATPASRRSKAS